MEKYMQQLSTSLLQSMVIAIFMAVAHSHIAQEPESVEQWFQKLRHSKQKVTKLHFFFHDIVGGKNPSAFQVAQANFSVQSHTHFGVVWMMDDALTVGPESDSGIIGRAQGIYASASLEDLGFLMTLNFVFTDAKFNGSTLSILGHNPAMHKYREMPIVGGSGVFRLARGIATAKTLLMNDVEAVVEYQAIVLHY